MAHGNNSTRHSCFMSKETWAQSHSSARGRIGDTHESMKANQLLSIEIVLLSTRTLPCSAAWLTADYVNLKILANSHFGSRPA